MITRPTSKPILSEKTRKCAAALLAGVVCLFSCAFTPLQSEDEALAALNEKGQQVHFEQPYQELASYAAELPNYEIYLSGEGHAVSMNFAMQKYLLQYFVEQHGVRYFLMEASFSEGELLNQYLETGDGELINTMVDSFEGSLAYNQDNFDLFRWLYRYNQSLPENKRLRVVAIDVEHQRDLSSLYLRGLLRDKQIPSSIQDVITPLRQNKDILWDQEFCEKLAASLEQNEAVYQKLLGPDFFSYSLACRNLLASTDNFTLRESAIISNFNALYQHLPKGKYFGQFGSSHIAKSKVLYGENEPEVDTFVQSINTSDALKGKVFTMRYLYNNCQYRDIDGKVVPVSNLEIPSFYGDTPSVLFLSRKNAPEIFYFLTGGDPILEGNAGDCIYLISNSAPVAKRLSLSQSAA